MRNDRNTRQYSLYKFCEYPSNISLGFIGDRTDIIEYLDYIQDNSRDTKEEEEMNSPWQYFSMKELTCQCGCGRMEMDADFMAIMVTIRRELGFPLIVTSGYRCPDHNNKISSTGFNGPHTKGATDIRISHERAFLLMGSALRHGITGIGVKQKGRKRFIHLDSLESPRPRVWSY